MPQPYLIAADPTASPYQRPLSGRGFPVKTIIVLWLLAGAGFLTWKLGFSSPKTLPAKGAPITETNIPKLAIGTDDLIHHLETVNDRLTDAESRLRRAEERVAKTLPSMDRNYLYVERQELHNALAASGAARQDIEMAREQSDLILKSIKEYQNK